MATKKQTEEQKAAAARQRKARATAMAKVKDTAAEKVDKANKAKNKALAALREFKRAPSLIARLGLANAVALIVAMMGRGLIDVANPKAAESKIMEYLARPYVAQTVIALPAIGVGLMHDKASPGARALIAAVVDGMTIPATVRAADAGYDKIKAKGDPLKFFSGPGRAVGQVPGVPRAQLGAPGVIPVTRYTVDKRQAARDALGV